jgi:adenylosuccinate synthase
MSDRDTDLAALVARAKQATCGYTHRELLQSIVNALAKLDPTPENPMVTIARELVRSAVVEVVSKELLVKEIADLKQQLEASKAKLDTEGLRLAACGHAAMDNLADGHPHRIGPSHTCYSASYQDVCAAVGREVSERLRAEKAEQQLTEAKANQNSALTTLLSWVREQKPLLATAHEYSELVSHGLRQAFAQTENHILRTMDTK